MKKKFDSWEEEKAWVLAHWPKPKPFPKLRRLLRWLRRKLHALVDMLLP